MNTATRAASAGARALATIAWWFDVAALHTARAASALERRAGRYTPRPHR